MREVRTGSNLQIRVPPGSAFACETPDLMPKMHFLCACVGKRGSGKMVASVNLLEKLQVVDRLFYVSPSADSNSAGLARLFGHGPGLFRGLAARCGLIEDRLAGLFPSRRGKR